MTRSRARLASRLAISAGLVAGLGVAWPVQLTHESVEADAVAKTHIRQDGKFAAGLRFADQAGEHLLVLTAKAYPSRKGEQRDRVDSHQLLAALYRPDGKRGWKREWLVRDGVVCPDLDSEAVFLLQGLTVTDLDGDGMAEVTIPYRKFCGGGVDTKDLRIVLRTRQLSFSLSGSSQLLIPGQPPMGGEHQADGALAQPQYGSFRDHLERTWLLVSPEKLGADGNP